MKRETRLIWQVVKEGLIVLFMALGLYAFVLLSFSF